MMRISKIFKANDEIFHSVLTETPIEFSVNCFGCLVVQMPMRYWTVQDDCYIVLDNSIEISLSENKKLIIKEIIN